MNRLLLSIQETAQQLSVSARTIRRMIDRQELPVVRVRGAVRIPVAAVESWVETCLTIPNNSGCVGPAVRKER